VIAPPEMIEGLDQRQGDSKSSARTRRMPQIQKVELATAPAPTPLGLELEQPRQQPSSG